MFKEPALPGPYLNVTQDAGREFFLSGKAEPIVMLNLLRFREVADYAASPDIALAHPVSGREAFDVYVAHTLPFLFASGGDLLFMGDAGPWLIGPAGESRDCAMLVRQASTDSFLAWNTDPEYLKGIGHRTAALADSRLLPLIERS